jgi:serine/threonine protein kinase
MKYVKPATPTKAFINGHLHPMLLKKTKDVIVGILYLHKKGIRHKNIQPNNILIYHGEEYGGGYCAKISNFRYYATHDEIMKSKDGR